MNRSPLYLFIYFFLGACVIGLLIRKKLPKDKEFHKDMIFVPGTCGWVLTLNCFQVRLFFCCFFFLRCLRCTSDGLLAFFFFFFFCGRFQDKLYGVPRCRSIGSRPGMSLPSPLVLNHLLLMSWSKEMWSMLWSFKGW